MVTVCDVVCCLLTLFDHTFQLAESSKILKTILRKVVKRVDESKSSEIGQKLVAGQADVRDGRQAKHLKNKIKAKSQNKVYF